MLIYQLKLRKRNNSSKASAESWRENRNVAVSAKKNAAENGEEAAKEAKEKRSEEEEKSAVSIRRVCLRRDRRGGLCNSLWKAVPEEREI
jgi:hypothetical protein